MSNTNLYTVTGLPECMHLAALLVKDTVMRRYYRALLGGAVVGIVLVVYNASDTHHWALYQTRESAREFIMRNFNSEIEPPSLETTADGIRVHFIVAFHPSYFEPQAALDLLSTPELDNSIFAEDAKFGKCAGDEAGKA